MEIGLNSSNFAVMLKLDKLRPTGPFVKPDTEHYYTRQH